MHGAEEVELLAARPLPGGVSSRHEEAIAATQLLLQGVSERRGAEQEGARSHHGTPSASDRGHVSV